MKRVPLIVSGIIISGMGCSPPLEQKQLSPTDGGAQGGVGNSIQAASWDAGAEYERKVAQWARLQFLKTCTPGTVTRAGYCPKMCSWIHGGEVLCEPNREVCVERFFSVVGNLGIREDVVGCLKICRDGACPPGFSCVKVPLRIPPEAKETGLYPVCAPQ